MHMYGIYNIDTGNCILYFATVAVLAPWLLKYLAMIGIYVVPKEVVDFFCKILDDAIKARGNEEVVSFSFRYYFACIIIS